MFHPSSIHPDVELRDLLDGNISVVVAEGESAPVAVYGDWEKSTNDSPDDFIVCMLNGDIDSVGMDTPFARGYIMVSLFCKLNDDGSVKKNRIDKILEQFDNLVEKKCTENYYFKYDTDRFITPTTPNQSTGYSITSLNLRWTTNSNFNKPEKP